MSVQFEPVLLVCETLIAEHRIMEKYLLALEKYLSKFCESTDISESLHGETQGLLATISKDIDNHFACEERALFPAVSPYHPMVLMEVEHEEIVELRNKLIEQFGKGQYSEFSETGKQFVEYLRDHISREDAGIFPACEQALSQDEKLTVTEKMEKIRSQAKIGAIQAIIRPQKSFKQICMKLEELPERALMIELLAETSELQIKHLTIRAGGSLPSHWSPKKLFILCVLGDAVFIAGQNEPIDLKAGIGLLLDPQFSHSIRANSTSHFLLILQETIA